MKIEKLEDKKCDTVEVGDVLVSKFTGNHYFIVETHDGKFGCVNLIRCTYDGNLYNSIEELVDNTVDGYELYKKDRIKLIIE